MVLKNVKKNCAAIQELMAVKHPEQAFLKNEGWQLIPFSANLEQFLSTFKSDWLSKSINKLFFPRYKLLQLKVPKKTKKKKKAT